MKSKKTIVRELKSLVGLMRLGILVAAVVLTAGCSGGGDDPGSSGSGSGSGSGPVTPEENKTPIVFSAQQQEGQDVTRAGQSVPGATRAVGLETVLGDGASFKVWGYKNMSISGNSYGSVQEVLPGYHVVYETNTANTTTSNTEGWEYVNKQNSGEEHQTIKYWDWGAKAYRFFGVTGNLDGAVKGEYYEIDIPVNGTSTTDISSIPYFSTLWFSDGNTTEGSYPFGRPVQLVFMKPYTRVRFKFSYSYAEGVIVTNPEFAPTTGSQNIACKGTFTVRYPLSGTGTKETYLSKPVDEGILDAMREDYDAPEKIETIQGWYYLLPNINQDKYTLQVIVNNELKVCTVPAEYMQWLPGYSYTYIFKITEQGGVEIDDVQMAFTPWIPMKTSVEVYNW